MHRLLKITLALTAIASPLTAAESWIVGSYNIRYDNSGDQKTGNTWRQRAPVVAGLIRFHKFDVLGTQEAFIHQLKDLQKLLPDHAFTGSGRDDGAEKGEHVAIFYRKGKFKLLDSGTFWLSDTPEKPGRGWDADLPRICTWASLEEIPGGRKFHVFNAHFDHRGVQARLESARLILRKIKEIAGDGPVILTGDFNVNQTGESYLALRDSGFLTDAHDTATERYALNGTANKFDPDAWTESRIDHVFLSRHFKPVRYGILTDSYRTPVGENGAESQSSNFPGEVKFKDFQARLPSDHFPVLVEVVF